jgi:ribosomal-protein-alanine N-acetyltransferase
VSPPRAVTLRPARASEASALAHLSRVLIEHGVRWRYTPVRMAQLIADPETVALVACDGRGAQGFSVMQFGDERAHLVLLCVQPALQRQGVGARLLQWQLASARVAGIVSVQLELRADNAGALAFYRRLGFAETGLLAGYYEGAIDALRMQLSLRG